MDLRCEGGHLWGRLVGGRVEFRCRYCTKRRGRPVYHLFDVVTGERETEVR